MREKIYHISIDLPSYLYGFLGGWALSFTRSFGVLLIKYKLYLVLLYLIYVAYLYFSFYRVHSFNDMLAGSP